MMNGTICYHYCCVLVSLSCVLRVDWSVIVLFAGVHLYFCIACFFSVLFGSFRFHQASETNDYPIQCLFPNHNNGTNVLPKTSLSTPIPCQPISSIPFTEHQVMRFHHKPSPRKPSPRKPSPHKCIRYSARARRLHPKANIWCILDHAAPPEPRGRPISSESVSKLGFTVSGT